MEGLSVPSKIYYMLAAGAALLVISRGPNELTDLVKRHQCGLAVPPHDPEAVLAAVHRFSSDAPFLALCRANARAAAVEHYSRRNTEAYIQTIARHISRADAT
jgi:glycosyltransferase involved in cell wall biosynthesis